MQQGIVIVMYLLCMKVGVSFTTNWHNERLMEKVMRCRSKEKSIWRMAPKNMSTISMISSSSSSILMVIGFHPWYSYTIIFYKVWYWLGTGICNMQCCHRAIASDSNIKTKSLALMVPRRWFKKFTFMYGCQIRLGILKANITWNTLKLENIDLQIC